MRDPGPPASLDVAGFEARLATAFERLPAGDSEASPLVALNVSGLLGRGAYDQSEIKHVVGWCDLFIAGRMRACIAAVSESISAVSIADSGKFIGVTETVGVGGLVADARKMHQAEILGTTEKACDARAVLAAVPTHGGGSTRHGDVFVPSDQASDLLILPSPRPQ